MLKFQMMDNGQPATHAKLRNAYLIGSDRSAMRAELWFADGQINCQKREVGASALALQHPVGECGEITAQTCLLPDRQEPYLLSLELARHRLMLMYAKLEEWGMFELPDEHPVSRRLDRARKLFIEALSHQSTSPVEADRLARESLAGSMDASEELALAHADLLLNRRKSVNSLPRNPLGCGVTLDQGSDRIRAALVSNFDFVHLPVPWRQLVPAEDQYRWDLIDGWTDWAVKSRVPVIAGPIISFEPSVLPDWIYMWEHDYETVRDLLYEHIEHVVSRYKNSVSAWIAVSGLHVNSHFTFSFDQLMEITRMCVMHIRKLQPAAKIYVEIRQPFGEYYSTNARSIPPHIYADLLVQNGVNFDGFALRMVMGQARPGQYIRDLMQVSNLLDQFGVHGKPIHLTIAAPSEPVSAIMIASEDGKEQVDPDCGFWRRPWSQTVQGRWLEAMCYIALSKPFVESVAWQEFIDHPDSELPLSGLVGEDHQPKHAFRRLVTFRRSLSLKSTSAIPTLPGLNTTPSAGPPPDVD